MSDKRLQQAFLDGTEMCACEQSSSCHHGICLECQSGEDDWKRQEESE